jgi:hypothetical protein
MGQVRAAGDRAIGSGRAPEIVLEQWISGLETKRAQPRVGPGDGERDDIPKRRDRAQHGPVASAALSTAPMAKMRETIEVRGSSVVFSDAIGGTIVSWRVRETVSCTSAPLPCGDPTVFLWGRCESMVLAKPRREASSLWPRGSDLRSTRSR